MYTLLFVIMLPICVNDDVCGCLYGQYKYNITLYNLIIKK